MWLLVGMVALVPALLFWRVLVPLRGTPSRPRWVSSGKSFPRRRTREPGPDRGTPFDLHNVRDLIIVVVAVLIFVAASVWLLSIRAAGLY